MFWILRINIIYFVQMALIYYESVENTLLNLNIVSRQQSIVLFYDGLFICSRHNLVFLLLHVLNICVQMTYLSYVEICFFLNIIKYVFFSPCCSHIISTNFEIKKILRMLSHKIQRFLWLSILRIFTFH